LFYRFLALVEPLETFPVPIYPPGVAGEKLSQNRLQTAEAVLSLGLVVVKGLQERRIATVFLNDDGDVELCPPGEYLHDALSEEDALMKLLDQGYSDEQLVAYLKGRKARSRNADG
jgi:hypothetical protein